MHWRHRFYINWLLLITLEVTKIIDLKHKSTNNLENIMKKMNVSQDNQLIEFITKIIELRNESESPKSEEIMRKTSVS